MSGSQDHGLPLSPKALESLKAERGPLVGPLFDDDLDAEAVAALARRLLDGVGKLHTRHPNAARLVGQAVDRLEVAAGLLALTELGLAIDPRVVGCDERGSTDDPEGRSR